MIINVTPVIDTGATSDVHPVFQCGARLGEDSGREDRHAAQALDLPLAEDDMGGPQV